MELLASVTVLDIAHIFIGTYEITLKQKNNDFGLFVPNAKIHCKCAHTLTLLSSNCASSRSCEHHYDHRPSPYTDMQAICDGTMTIRQWQWKRELPSSSPPRL